MASKKKTRKIAISLNKGGVAKSSTAVSMSHGLARAGKKVLLIDTDAQGQDSFLLGLTPESGLAEVVAGDINPHEAMTPARENLWLLAGGASLAGVEREIARSNYGGENTLSKALSCFDGEFDYIILDTGPTWSSMMINTLFYADEILAPVSLEVLTLNSLVEYSSRLADIQKHKPSLKLKYVLPTFFDRRVKKSQEILSQIKKHYKKQICDPINYNVRMSEAPGYGQTIFEHAPSSVGAKGYKKLIDRVMKDGR